MHLNGQSLCGPPARHAVARGGLSGGGARIESASSGSQPVAVPMRRRTGAAAAQRLDLAGALWTLVRTDFKARYHGTVMGFVWAMPKPVAMFLVLMSVFTFVFSNQPDYPI